MLIVALYVRDETKQGLALEYAVGGGIRGDCSGRDFGLLLDVHVLLLLYSNKEEDKEE